jgi:cell division protein ZapA
MSKNTVTVQILDIDYQISCPEDQQKVLQESARQLDSSMREIKQRGTIIGLDRIAIMAGINLSYQLINNDQLGADNTILDNLHTKLDQAITKYQRLGLTK